MKANGKNVSDLQVMDKILQILIIRWQVTTIEESKDLDVGSIKGIHYKPTNNV